MSQIAARWTGNGVTDGTSITPGNATNTGNYSGSGASWSYAYSGSPLAVYEGSGFRVVSTTSEDISRIDATMTNSGSAMRLQMVVTARNFFSSDWGRIMAVRSASNWAGHVMFATDGRLAVEDLSGVIIAASYSPAVALSDRLLVDFVVAQAAAPTTSNGRLFYRVTNLTNPSWNGSGEYFWDSGYNRNLGTAPLASARFGKITFPATPGSGIVYEQLGAESITVNPSHTSETQAKAYFANPPSTSQGSMPTQRWHVVDGVRRRLGRRQDEPPVGDTIYAGALPLGTANYTPVGAVRYVATNGSNSNSGTIDAPWVGLQHAINNTPTGGTIVMRGGVHYQGSLTAPHGKVLRIQNQPGEAAWVDGTTVISGFTQSGSTWVAPYMINHSRFDTTGFPGSNPLRNHPDQVWVGSVRLIQVADNTTPGAGQFSVNQGAQTLRIGTNPGGQTVRAVEHAQLIVSSARVDLLGIGIRRYSPQATQFGNSAIYYGGTSEGVVVENCHFRDSHMMFLNFTKADSRATSNTFRDGGYTGVGVTTGDRLLVEKNLFVNLNRELWGGAPELAAVKVTRCDQPVLRWNYVEQIPNGAGMWYDVSNIRTQMYGNYVDGRDKGNGNMGALFFQEISDGGYINGVQYRNFVVGNYGIGGNTGMNAVQSSYTEWWCNTITGSATCLQIKQDSNGNTGDNPANRPPSVCPWNPYYVFAYNNDINQNTIPSGWAAGIRASDVRPADYKTPPYLESLGWDMIERLEGNWLRPGPGNGVNMVELGRADGSRSSFNSLSALQTSGANVGGPPGAKLGPNHISTTSPSPSQVAATALSTPANIANMLGVPTGTKMIGHNPANLPVPRME